MIITIMVVLAALTLSVVLFLRGNGLAAGVVCLIALIGGFAAINVSINNYNERTLECTITDKDRGYNAESDSSEYRVYTEQCGTLSNEDSWLRGKFNSGDIQGQLQVGKTYELTIAGPRSGFLSMFPNIYKVQEVN